MDDLHIIRGITPDPSPAHEECKEDRAHADEAAELIGRSFEWAETAEGRDFWSDVCDRLRQIARNGRLR